MTNVREEAARRCCENWRAETEEKADSHRAALRDRLFLSTSRQELRGDAARQGGRFAYLRYSGVIQSHKGGLSKVDTLQVLPATGQASLPAAVVSLHLYRDTSRADEITRETARLPAGYPFARSQIKGAGRV
jgi:hypothetical protein